MKHQPLHAHRPTLRRRDMNLEFIASNLAEAQADIYRLLHRLGHPDLTVGKLQVTIGYIAHHLLIAWNGRHIPHGRQATLSEDEWAKYWRMPEDIYPFGRPDKSMPTKLRKSKFDRQWARRHLYRHWTHSNRPPGYR